MLIGYADKLSVDAGDHVDIKVSAAGIYRSQLVRLRGMKEGAAGLSVAEESLSSKSNGQHTGRVQALHPGSFIDVALPRVDFAKGVGVSLCVKPTAPGRLCQTLFSLSDDSSVTRMMLELDRAGRPAMYLRSSNGAVTTVSSPDPLPKGRWVFLKAVYDPGEAELRLTAEEQTGAHRWSTPVIVAEGSAARFRVGAAHAEDGRATDCFNGCVSEVNVFGASPKLPILQWDFSRQMDSDIAVDVSGAGRHGRLLNRPARAVLGPAWDKKTIRWTDDPPQWNALHLHDDDLDDAQWRTDFEVEAPAESGIYAVRLNQGETTYYIPFYVRPAAVRKRVLFVAPTNTYLAYGNEHLWEGERGIAHQKMMSFPIVLDKAETILQQMPSLGRSLYDRHSDDSGVIYASRLRPLTNMQPNYINWLAGGPRHFSGDFFITGWLDSIGVEFDVATDEDVDSLGKDLLDSYDVVLTGSHPEYPTAAEFDAFENYVKGGGKLMYLGANGFFWATSYVNKLRTAIEVRRGYAAQRNWTSHAAELYHSSTGEMGGAYRHRGRDQNPFLGVGMAAAGWGPASGFTRTPESYAEAVAWVFEDIASETLGEHGYLLGGAAGDELDHADPARGTPDSTVVLMSSRHNDLFFPSLDSVTEVAPNQQGSKNPHVRADVVLVDHPGGGKVFSTGSICWAGSLGTNNYDNDIAKLTTNVLRKFLGG
ncbi:hypothetical protein EN852_013530 [Mesorhizobium sp. M2E.F.Ca.ET.209.01.1.1]|uniref:N,N-dimethylformamidase beta subunit family domain-containing protein n=1 Tax=Mesorhizobium sp. M2E.F.Ca.ET.209.01.1.1 TaxID=2500526 RepID=UPI000FDC941C|nr:N,N-dimethylformamidase beta subunit family domain-containing protein [Mesorhizobium sp. M2E.F.Ca.ET.209.01.1.1]TGS14250.1 hypothetical protein EN852_013530 [Mesorhizobium sp. M2E.F.Ca.ET.209.01.1.1]